MFKKIAVAAIATSLTISASVSCAGPKAEVLHWWTSVEKLISSSSSKRIPRKWWIMD